jgi:hypothetical protein
MRTTATTINAQSTPLTQNAFVIDAVGDLAKPVTITHRPEPHAQSNELLTATRRSVLNR